MSKLHWLFCVLVAYSTTTSGDVDVDQDMELLAPDAGMMYFRPMGRCEEPKAPANGKLACGLPKNHRSEVLCKAECLDGFAFPDGKTRKAAVCDLPTANWDPQLEFPDCVQGCPALAEVSYGTVTCQTQGKNYTCTAKCNRGFQFSNQVEQNTKICDSESKTWLPDDKFPFCIQMCINLMSPKHGNISCNSNSDKNMCTAECYKTYKFPNGLQKMERSCDYSTGIWTPKETIPDCVSRCEEPTYPINGSVTCEINNVSSSYICHASCMPGFRFTSGERTLDHVCQLETGIWDSEFKFPGCIDPCINPNAPINGSITCDISNNTKICTTSCQDGLFFPNGDSFDTASCDLTKGKWISELNYDACFRPCFGSGYLNVPKYGSRSCKIDEISTTCNASCDRGFEFATNATTSLSCNTKTGVWSPRFAFPDCTVMCNIPKEPKNSVLICERSSEDKTKYVCEAECKKGYQFPNGKLKMQHYCDLESLEWSPRPYFLDCVPICQTPSSPLNGEVYCFPNSQDNTSYNCEATCISGYEFQDGNQKIIHSCSLETGEWVPKMEFPDCVEVCKPTCQNNGICAGNNTCICEKEFRGDRCQYVRDVCTPSKAFHESAGWDCADVSDGYHCLMKCSAGTTFSFPPSPSYHCSFNGTWTPNTAPTCDQMDVIIPPPPPPANPLPPPEIPDKGICATWNRRHYSTFDGNIYNFKGFCTYLLAKDCVDGTFAIHVDHQKQALVIYIGKASYTLTFILGIATIEYKEKLHHSPAWIDGLMFKSVAHYTRVVSNSLGFGLKWDGGSTVLFKVSSIMFNKTCGLCGNFDTYKENDWQKSDGNIAFDVEDFADSWKIENFLDKCEKPIDKNHPCSTADTHLVKKANEACQIIMDSRFQSCHKILDVEKYYEACTMDFCEREALDENYICNSLSHYFRECTRLGQRLAGGWRNETVCPLNCQNGQVYNDCGSACPKTCDNHIYNCESDHCVDGCHCPTGTVFLDGKCILQEDCPCEKNGKLYQKGEKLQRECQTCICMGGKFQCTKDNCLTTCSSVGGPHYTTFDGYKYDYVTTCPVYLVYSDNFTIIQENTECSSETRSTEVTYCIKEIQINIGDSSLVLKSDPAPLFNGRQVPDHPFTENGITVYRATSSFIKVELPNSLSVLWDGKNQIFIDAPLSLMDKTKGLCGTFNHNQKDDFVTPNGDIEADIPSFVARWHYYDTCHNRARRREQSECDQQTQNVQESEVFCAFLKGDTFSKCHNEVDPNKHHQDCMNDICSCQGRLFECICPIFKHYSYLCAKKGVILDWIDEMQGCKPECSVGKVYQECSNPCKSSCHTIAEAKHCIQSCVPGCSCPEGLTLDDEGNCLPINRCPCVVNGREYSAQTSSLQGANICECNNAKLICHPASGDGSLFPSINGTFNCSGNEEFTTCVEDCPETCQNTLLKHRCQTKVCRVGCKCKQGYILDFGKCVEKSECGCRHGGKKYSDGYKMKYDCNQCTCNDGKWKCSMKTCPGRCTVWGSSHFKTFDGYIYDFNGNCEYVLSMGELSDGTTFTVSLQNTPCGTSGVTCSRSFTLDVHINGTGSKRVVLSEIAPLPKQQYTPPFVYDNGLYVFVFTDIGLSLQWDKSTRLYVMLDPKWRNRVSGLCGNYDDNWDNDFQTPAGGLPEAQPMLFANSWKLRETCPQTSLLPDACSSHPFRRTWARKKCSVLNSPLFERCHSEVSVKPYHDKCVFDTCTCDEGGDCECLCTSIAAYAQECNINGIHIKWRSQDLCPIQCESCAKYESCRSLCPKETCENQIFFRNVESYCASDVCIEGCNPDPCPPGHIYNNSRDFKCIPRVQCRTPCHEVNGKMYYEGEQVKHINIDECQRCHCILGEISCTGTPCDLIDPTKCTEDGWTPWLDISPSTDKTYELIEGLSATTRLKNYCGLGNITNVECKINGNISKCNLEGPFCTLDDPTSCKKYAVRVYCHCVKTTLPPTTETLFTLPSTTVSALCPSGEIYDECAYRCNQTCHSFRQELLQRANCQTNDNDECVKGCRPMIGCPTPSLWRDYSTCVDKGKCTCSFIDGNTTILAPNDVIKQECKTCQCVNNDVQCVDIPDCPATTTISTLSTTLTHFITSIFTSTPEPTTVEILTPDIVGPDCWTQWINNSSLSVGGDFEDANSARRKYQFCSNPVKIECRTVGDKKKAQVSGQKLECDLEKGLQCFDLDNAPDGCFDYEIRFFCPCETTTPMPATTVTIKPSPPAPCVNGLTDWYNSHVPDESGEFETVQSVREYGGYFCDSSMIGSIQCREKGSSGETPMQANVICNLELGLKCLNSDLRNCSDYEVRFNCDCPVSTHPTSTPSTTVTTTTETPISTTRLMTPVPCAHWSEWINENHPHNDTTIKRQGVKMHIKERIGDKEHKTLPQLKNADFCLKGYLSDIECQTADTGIDYSKAEDVHLLCDLDKGFECRGVDQPSKHCHDYKIRYFCSCEAETSTPTIIIQPTTISPISTCSSFYFLINGPRLPDRSFKASSSLLNATTGPHNARISHRQTAKTAGGWVPSATDKNPYLEMDLDFVKPVYGVVTKGRHGAEEWVTSYHVIYSRNGQTWSYIQDFKENNKIFHGNHDSNTRNIHVFKHPFEARYVRIVPLSWEKNIGLRADLLGCGEGTKYIIQFRITRFICADKMGLQNRDLQDQQIGFSSINDIYAGASSIRLNTKQVDGHGGGWVAGTLDSNQYVQIDFFGLRNLTGIITQGRDHVDQWVKAYEISYSQDGDIWHKILNSDGNVLVFTGNFDRDTQVRNYFPSPIRARYLQVIPKLWKNRIALRLEIIGCYEPYNVASSPTPMHGITVTPSTEPSCLQYGPWLSLHDSTHVQGDHEPIAEIINVTALCPNPMEIQCRDVVTLLSSTNNENVTCDLQQGLICNNSNQALGHCPNYEVRIGCWMCDKETVTIMPIIQCPEVPPSLLDRCPESCPKDYACDGSKCVPYGNCPCFKEKYFYAGDIQYTSDCQLCDCMVGGRTKCNPVVCSRTSCKTGEMSIVNKTCQCHCEKCPSGKILCPTTNQCIDKAHWCDGIVDCVDDEVNCPTAPTLLPTETTTSPAETTISPAETTISPAETTISPAETTISPAETTISPAETTISPAETTISPAETTTSVPSTCNLNVLSETDSCTLSANVIQTFDRQWYIYETCRHILMKEKSHESFAVTVHSTCLDSQVAPCEHYVVINVGEVTVQLGPGITGVQVNNTEIQVQNLWLISKKHADSFSLRKSGNHIIFESYKYHFQVAWDATHDIAITVSKCLLYKLVGLCGNYNAVREDDMQKPDGSIVTVTKEFGDSWSIGLVGSCFPAKCSTKAMEQAVIKCKALREEPFSSCSSYLKLDAHFEACLSHMCDCLQNFSSNDQLESCKCQVYESFAEKCEVAKGSVIESWRIKYDCSAKCEGNREWKDCGPGCELTCDNYRKRKTICVKSCVPGCYCPSGLVLHQGKCVSPKLCQDCMCTGQGDPNYVSFDFNYFAFQGNCTYVLAQHQSGDKNKDFQILGTNIECPKYPHATCVKKIKLLWNKQVVEKVQNEQVYFNSMPLPDDVTNFKKNGVEVLVWKDRKTTKIIIEAVNLVLTYYDSLPAYHIALPSYFYYNKTEGLCGICNSNSSDDMYHSGGFISNNLEDFAYSWLVNNTRDKCTLPTGPLNPPPYNCSFSVPSCNMVVDPEPYVKSCENDAAYNVNASTCAAKYMYAQQCCERGISVTDWILENKCAQCPTGLHLECISGCQRTCDNYKSKNLSSCDSSPHFECVCPDAKILKGEKCVDPILCETCDTDGHVVNDTWFTDDCTKCECDQALHVKCVTTQCPPPPICLSKDIVSTQEPEPGTCCKSYQCESAPPAGCDPPTVIPCHSGKTLVKVIENNCTVYKCECRKESCPLVFKPTSSEVGEKYVLEEVDCCKKYISKCVPISQCPPHPDCPIGFSLSFFRGKCCNMYKCVPKGDACVYKYMYDIVNGSQVLLPVKKQRFAEYKPGTSWRDGLCRNCSCSEADKIFTYSCQIRECMDIHLNSEYSKYEWNVEQIPGECCPRYTRVKCKVGEKLYSAGEKWPSYTGDKCKSYHCLLLGNEVILQEITLQCDTICPANTVYVPPKLESPNCCGHCQPTGCQENGVIYEIGASWQSQIKRCMKAECIARDDNIMIHYISKICPDLPTTCAPGQLIYDADGCCPHCEVGKESCAASVVPLADTVAYFNLTDASRGICSNTKPIANLTKCTGQCEGVSLYSKSVGNFESTCRCCLPMKTEKLMVYLRCTKGMTIKKIYQQPVSCHCVSCQ